MGNIKTVGESSISKVTIHPLETQPKAVDSDSAGIMQRLRTIGSGFGSRLNRTILAGMSLTAIAALSEGCRAELLPPPTLSFDDIGHNRVEEVSGDANDSSSNPDVLYVNDGFDDENDSSTDSAILDQNDADDTDNSSTDSAILDQNDADDTDNSSTDSAILDQTDASDTDNSGTDSAILDQTDVDDTDNSSTDSAILDQNDADNTDNSSTDSAILDQNDADNTDNVQPPKTCDGEPIGTFNTFYTAKPETIGKGICAQGIKVCDDNGVWTVVKPEVTPQNSDLCDGVDNDCDGITDPKVVSYPGPFGTEGVGICQPQIEKCFGDKYFVDQNAVLPQAEVCNSKDDDCNGQTDEDQKVESYDGNLATQGIGICQSQVKECINGTMIITQSQVLPNFENCDGLDNDCDGKTDEDTNQEAYTGDPKTKGIGICMPEIQECIGGKMQTTQVQVLPVEEICQDGIDNNCDGKTDEGLCDCDPDKDGIITDMIKDPLFLEALRIWLKKGPSDPITLEDAKMATIISVPSKGIKNLAGIECFTNAEELNFIFNNLTSINQLEGLPNMHNLALSHNPSITDITPLVKNLKLGAGDLVYLLANIKIPAAQIDALKAKGVKVYQ